MHLTDLITPDRIRVDVESASKKRALEQLSALIASGQDHLGTGEIFDSLIARERLGSTGLGHGVAIPHGRVKTSEETIGAFVRLRAPVDYDAIDEQPVDLLFALLVPEKSTEQHLQMLSQLAEMFSDEAFRRQLREATDERMLYDLFKEWQPE